MRQVVDALVAGGEQFRTRTPKGHSGMLSTKTGGAPEL